MYNLLRGAKAKYWDGVFCLFIIAEGVPHSWQEGKMFHPWVLPTNSIQECSEMLSIYRIYGNAVVGFTLFIRSRGEDFNPSNRVWNIKRRHQKQSRCATKLDGANLFVS